MQNFINKELLKVQKNGPTILDKKRDVLISEAEIYISSIEAQITPAYIKTAMIFFLKFWESAFSQIIFNVDQLQKIQILIKSQKSNVILVPTNRSYLDMWLLSFIH